MQKSSRIKLMSVFFAMIFVTANSCKWEIDLGPKKKKTTEAGVPVLVVNETPKSGEVIRDKFLLSGSCSDDIEPVGLTITFKSTRQDSSLRYSFAGENDKGIKINDDGSWSLLVNPLDKNNPILDGEYEVEFYVTDKDKHEVKEKKFLRIDNTPPVVVLERPASKANASIDTFDAYGQSFNILGQHADANGISLIEINVYEHIPVLPQDRPLHTITLNNVPARINMEAAKWKQASVDSVKGESFFPYEKIYKSNVKNGTKSLYFTMNAYDSAVRYPVNNDGTAGLQSSADKKGNCNNGIYFLYKDILEILSEYTITDLYNIFSNVYAGENRIASNPSEIDTTTINAVKELLNIREVTSGGFSLNPDNSPVFSVIGREELKCDGLDFADNNTEQLVLNGSSATIEVSPGLDLISLAASEVSESYNPESDLIKIFIQECDEYGEIKQNTPRIYPTSVKKQKVNATYRFSIDMKKDANKTCVIVNEGQNIERVEWCDAKLVFGRNYRFGVEGKDDKGNEVKEKLAADNSSIVYGFKFVSSGAAPGLELTEPAENIIYLPKGRGLTISGDIITEEGGANLEIYRGNDLIDFVQFNESDFITETGTDGEYLKTTFVRELPSAIFNQGKSGQYAFKIIASNGKRSEVGKTVVYDLDAPIIEINDEKPLASGTFKINKGEDDNGETIYETLERSDFINDVFTVRGTVIDDYDRVEETKWEFFQEGKVVDSGIIEGNNFKLELDTKKKVNNKSVYKDNAEGKLRITSADRAGNEDCLERTYYIYQESDYPLIEVRNPEELSLNITTMNDLRTELDSGGARNKGSEGQQFGLRFTDDDGIKNINIVTKTATTGEVYDILDLNGNNSTEYIYMYGVPTTPGYYIVTITVTDINDVANRPNKSDRFCILIINKKYKIDLSASPDWITTLTTEQDPHQRGDAKTFFTVYGKNSGDEKFIKVDVTDDINDRGAHNIRFQPNTNGLEWTDKFTPDPYIFNEERLYQTIKTDEKEEIYEVSYTATGYTDGQLTKDETFSYKIDNVKPVISISTMPDKDTSTLSSFKITGTSSDEGSGLSTVEVMAADENGHDTGWQQAALGGDGSWFYTLVYGDFSTVFGTNGIKTIKARAYDVVGNCSVIYSGDFIYQGQ